MIRSHDRSRWIGASDTAMVMGRWTSATFANWWLVKLGIRHDDYRSLAMMTGSAYEHRVLDALGVKKRDRQIKIKAIRLRVNLDGEDETTIYEVKTHGAVFKVSRAYWMQCQIETFAANKPCVIAAYKLDAEDYRNWYKEIDPSRLTMHPIAHDGEWVAREYLPRLRYLADCIRKGAWPDAGRFGAD